MLIFNRSCILNHPNILGYKRNLNLSRVDCHVVDNYVLPVVMFTEEHLLPEELRHIDGKLVRTRLDEGTYRRSTDIWINKVTRFLGAVIIEIIGK